MIALGESIAHALIAAEENALVEGMTERYGNDVMYRGWRFMWEYPGFACFVRPSHTGGCGVICGVMVCCTPDWEGYGHIAISVHDNDGEPLRRTDPRVRGGADVCCSIPFLVSRTVDAWFDAVKPWLDHYTPEGW